MAGADPQLRNATAITSGEKARLCDRPRPTFGILVLSQPSYLFCPIPADTPFVIPHCGLLVLCSVILTYSTAVGCPKTLLTCGVIRSYNS